MDYLQEVLAKAAASLADAAMIIAELERDKVLTSSEAGTHVALARFVVGRAIENVKTAARAVQP